MIKKIVFLVFLFLAACGSSPKELFETAELELLQTNYPHASMLYREIIDKHPDSEFAGSARRRLTEIQDLLEKQQRPQAPGK
ncbi:MAG: hypothetical protein BM485_16675 [Desulfobulbaceae bacterium DB1]|nr:MAG: hypothetical protein BM485_16675 [Desulfobulbaceae bacterium DB1]